MCQSSSAWTEQIFLWNIHGSSEQYCIVKHWQCTTCITWSNLKPCDYQDNYRLVSLLHLWRYQQRDSHYPTSLSHGGRIYLQFFKEFHLSQLWVVFFVKFVWQTIWELHSCRCQTTRSWILNIKFYIEKVTAIVMFCKSFDSSRCVWASRKENELILYRGNRKRCLTQCTHAYSELYCECMQCLKGHDYHVSEGGKHRLNDESEKSNSYGS